MGYSPAFDLANAPFGYRNRSRKCTSEIDGDVISVRGGKKFLEVKDTVLCVIGRVPMIFELELATPLRGV